MRPLHSYTIIGRYDQLLLPDCHSTFIKNQTAWIKASRVRSPAATPPPPPPPPRTALPNGACSSITIKYYSTMFLYFVVMPVNLATPLEFPAAYFHSACYSVEYSNSWHPGQFENNNDYALKVIQITIIIIVSWAITVAYELLFCFLVFIIILSCFVFSMWSILKFMIFVYYMYYVVNYIFYVSFY